MNKYEEFKARKVETVSQLIEKLEQFPPDASVESTGGDVGGYDVTSANYLDLKYNQEKNSISFSHMEYEMYRAVQKGLITLEQFKELNNEI